MFKLMIKTHNKTNLKYLCITKKDDYIKYTGSGKYWKNHLKKHGVDINTVLLFQHDDYEIFVQECLYYSVLYNVVLDEEWANAIPEAGYDNNNLGENNFVIWWKIASNELKKTVIESRKEKQILNHWTKSAEKNIIKEKISIIAKERWLDFSVDARRLLIENLRKGHKNFFDTKGENYNKWKENLSKSTIIRFANEPFEIKSKRNSEQRKNLSPEKKLKRKIKIQEIWATGKHDHLFEKLSEERMGINNPYAKIYVWENVKFTKSQFKKYCIDNNLTKQFLENKFLTDLTCIEPTVIEKKYPTLQCPHCNKQTNKIPSSFKRWHFDNCKMKDK